MQVKTVTIKSDIEKELNTAIKKIEQANFRVVDIKMIVPKQSFLLMCEPIRKVTHYGYQNKQLVNSTESMATQKQVNYIETLANKAGESINTDNLTKQQAGILIGKLKKEAQANSANNFKGDQAEIEPDFKLDDLNKLDL